MTTYQATYVGTLADYDHGEAWITFQWPDKLHGTEGLRIDHLGHCSRNMPLRSGSGQLELSLKRESLQIRFESSLARKLELEETIEIRLNIDDNDYFELQKFVDQF